MDPFQWHSYFTQRFDCHTIKMIRAQKKDTSIHNNKFCGSWTPFYVVYRAIFCYKQKIAKRLIMITGIYNITKKCNNKKSVIMYLI